MNNNLLMCGVMTAFGLGDNFLTGYIGIGVISFFITCLAFVCYAIAFNGLLCFLEEL